MVGGIMEEDYVEREIRRILILNFLIIAGPVVWDTVSLYFKTGQIKLTLPDLSSLLFYLVFANAVDVYFSYLPMKRTVAELKLKGYKVTDNSINIHQYRKIELDVDFNTACILFVNYLKTLTNCRIIKQDCDNGFITADHNLNKWKIFRDRIEFDIKKQSDEKTVVKINREQLHLGGLYCSRNYIMMEETLDYLKRKTGSEKFRVLETEETFD